MVDFAVIVKTQQLDGEWEEVARIDCCHGHAHLHHLNGTVTSLAPLHSWEDVNANVALALTAAQNYATTIRDVKENDG
ncbi:MULTISPECIES: hypothetical protein [unclassified Frondihabitans]|uniref:DUF7718 family protein n=1 Tax=unclassified Frondihabitans TaxID=2626248 RepID=UPI000F508003|nr:MULTISPECIES: hypothetical protein [unclassified Frondihabitans]RPE77864.1 hypothetical protein EDF37_0529 [Frondihabitans sp. PhB153]RPF08143.1 hypothetical protein EDF39_0530 [Frondihabitans sp. PhB161]